MDRFSYINCNSVKSCKLWHVAFIFLFSMFSVFIPKIFIDIWCFFSSWEGRSKNLALSKPSFLLSTPPFALSLSKTLFHPPISPSLHPSSLGLSHYGGSRVEGTGGRCRNSLMKIIYLETNNRTSETNLFPLTSFQCGKTNYFCPRSSLFSPTCRDKGSY